MIGFVVGTFLGGAVGVTTMCLLVASGREDKAEGLEPDERRTEKRN